MYIAYDFSTGSDVFITKAQEFMWKWTKFFSQFFGAVFTFYTCINFTYVNFAITFASRHVDKGLHSSGISQKTYFLKLISQI